ncbi:sulfatase-like hydrolase/transferase [Halogeometricum sp. S1BR25-6]|uniref:Sulfatase-like hydrolase/transferase n=1 Tax=Halogeometricum salsisoli TaxID=2950536 RepID=A0ABU2GHH6_9EURY|nr:sulfatase-like hydrolase/transferase [Halogeometricum sp. S1BR25-6]MDS0300241.1 sulfatase-like hydrolase/transferase [Halogeometricum sp. S1BR25-6]
MRNVVLICLDSIRKDYFDKYAPRLAQRADINFSQCRAASSWSVPSHASMFTGALPSDHGVHTHNMRFEGISEESFTKALSEHNSICVSANGFTTKEFGFDSLFDELVSVHPGRRFTNGEDAGGKSVREILRDIPSADHPLVSLLNGAYSKLYWLVDLLPIPSPFDQGAKLIRKHSLKRLSSSSEPAFLFTNFMEGHLPHQPQLQLNSDLHSVPWSWTSTKFDHFEANRQGEEYLKDHSEDINNFRDLYTSNIDYLDRQVVEMIDDIDSQTALETTFVITSDHGENLGYDDEDNLVAHRSSLSEALLHVPLCVVNPPSDWYSTESVHEFISHLELPKIVESLAKEQTFEAKHHPVSAELIGGGAKIVSEDEYWNRMIRCSYVDSQKYEWDSLGSSTLYELDLSKPCKIQRRENGVTIPDTAKTAFTTEISQYKSDITSQSTQDLNSEVDAGTQERLKDLGYL